MKAILFISSLFFLSPLLQAQTLLDKIVAVVGDNIVLESDLEIQYQQSVAQGTPGEGLKCQILDQSLLQKMMYTQAVIDSIEVSPDEVESELNSRFNYYVTVLGSEEKFEEYFKKTVVEFKDEFREDIREQLMAQRMQGQIINSVSVTPSEVKTFFKTIPIDSLPYFNAEVEIGQLVLKPEAASEDQKKAKDLLLEIKERVSNGESFAKLAAVYSEEPGASQSGGALGFKKRGELVPQFEAVAYKMGKDEISDVVETQFGYHLIQLLERRGEQINTRHILIRPDFSEKSIQEASVKLDSIRNSILDSTFSFAEAVEKFSQDEASKLNGGMLVNQQTGNSVFEMDALDPEIFFAIDTLKKGDISKPIPAKDRTGMPELRLYYIKSRTKAHLANLTDDYTKIQNVAKAEKQQKKLFEWINENTAKTYIKIDEKYQECTSLDKWTRRNE